MPFNRPTLADLIARADAEISSRLGLGPLLRRGVLSVIARTLAGLTHELHGRLLWISRQLLPDTAEQEYLERHGIIRGVPRKAATFAVGNVTFTGTETTVIGKGTRLVRADGVAFTVDRLVTILGGSALAAVTAEEAGVGGNTAAATVLSLASPIGGIDSDVTVDPDGLSSGADEETDAALRARILEVWQAPPQGGSATDYEIWAKEVAGVTRAWALPLHLGAGTVGVTFVEDDNELGIIPSAGSVAAVQTHIDARRPATAVATVFAPGVLAMDVTLTLVPNTAEVQAQVNDALAAMLKRDTEPGAGILMSRIDEAISLAAGETDHTISNVKTTPGSATPALPLAVQPAAGEIVVLGTTVFT